MKRLGKMLYEDGDELRGKWGFIVEYEGFRCCVTTHNQNTDRNHFEYVLDKHHSVDRTF
jgi:hypothetical protein